MGKSNPRNRTRNRADPTSKPIKPPSDPELAAIREQRILPVLKDLQSADLKARSTAASAITNIIEDTRCRKLLLREQIVRILLEQTLTDSSLETRTAGWGILRNLALEEEADFSVHLYRQDVLTAIEGVVKTVSFRLVLGKSYAHHIPDNPDHRIPGNSSHEAPKTSTRSRVEPYKLSHQLTLFSI